MDKYFKTTKTAKLPKHHATSFKPEPEEAQDQEYLEYTKTLKKFDLEPRYGPSIGLTRKERWNRAYQLGLKPPSEILSILEENPSLEGIGFLEAQIHSF